MNVTGLLTDGWLTEVTGLTTDGWLVPVTEDIVIVREILCLNSFIRNKQTMELCSPYEAPDE